LCPYLGAVLLIQISWPVTTNALPLALLGEA
jgi:hypothetical protein